MSEKVRSHIHIDPELDKEVREAARIEFRTFSGQVEQLIREALDGREEKRIQGHT